MEKIFTFIFILTMAIQTNFAQKNDPNQWLEAVDDEKALKWVEKWNEKTLGKLTAQEDYQNIYEKNLEILNSDERIASPAIYGDYIYNFWQDQQYQRGIWRRTTTKSYLEGNPEWEILLNIDKLSEESGIKWVFKGANGLYPDYNRFMVSLSKGGGDAVVIKEFDVTSKSFVKDGFVVPEAKGSVGWIDKNTLMVSTDFGEGVTQSGYPVQVKIWKRGTALQKAREIFRGKETDMGIWGYTLPAEEKTYQVITRRTSFYEGDYFFLENGKLVKPELPDDIELTTIFDGHVIFQLKSDWKVNGKTFSQGAVIGIDYDDLTLGKTNFELILQPGKRSAISGITQTKDRLLVNMLVNVKSQLFAFYPNNPNNRWRKEKIAIPDFGTVSLGASDKFSNRFFFYYENFLEPSALYHGDAQTGSVSKVKALPDWFDTENLTVEQLEAVSKDGTRIPYYVVHSKSMKRDGKNPTLLYAYGGFEIPMLPGYSAIRGTAWLEKGGVYVLANLRGGGEFGPRWHQAGIKENRQRVFDDFHAVAEDVIQRGITSPEKLGIYGGSNGGLLVGVAFTQRPDLYEAVVCAVPLLDMKRYNKLLAGASWMAEYGNPDIPEEWNYIKKYSPYHNVKKGEAYPEVFFTTSTRDDRVHPGHARKMVARMNNMGYNVYYYENTEGGHAGASTNQQRAKRDALIYSYLHMKLMDEK